MPSSVDVFSPLQKLCQHASSADEPEPMPSVKKWKLVSLQKQLWEYFEMPLYWYHMFWKSLYIHEENSQKLAKLIQYEPKHLNFCRQVRAAWLFFVVAYNHIGKVNTITPGASKWAKIKKNWCFTLIIHPNHHAVPTTCWFQGSVELREQACGEHSVSSIRRAHLVAVDALPVDCNTKTGTRHNTHLYKVEERKLMANGDWG